jgi:hypothetical protein
VKAQFKGMAAAVAAAQQLELLTAATFRHLATTVASIASITRTLEVATALAAVTAAVLAAD